MLHNGRGGLAYDDDAETLGFLHETFDTTNPYVRYPRMERGFPRHYIDETAQEILFDPTRVLSCGFNEQILPTDQVALIQPRIEQPIYRVERTIDPTVPWGTLCKPPPSQLTYIKRQIHLDQSRDSETFFGTGCVDIDPSDGVTPTSAVALAFTTLPNLRTFVRWIDFTVFDALDPSLISIGIKVDGVPRPFIKSTSETTTGVPGPPPPGYIPGPVDTFSTPGFLDLKCMPPYFHNILQEVTDAHYVEYEVQNLAPAVRRVCVCVWGWIESITTWDEYVKR